MWPTTNTGVGIRRKSNHYTPGYKPLASDFDQVPLIGRDRIVEKIAETVGPGASGALVLGEPGAGKTVLLEHVSRTLSDDLYIVQVRGSSIGARTPYGALRFMLDVMDGDEPMHPVFVFQNLSALLRHRAEARAVVLLIDNAHLLDELAAAVIGLLARSGMATIVAASNGIGPLSSDLAGLWKDGLLDLHRIEPFTPAESQAWIAAAVNANISRLTAKVLWAQTHGNPLLLRTLVAEQIRTGTLINKDGTCALAAEVVLDGKPLSDVVGARLNRLTARERSVLELLALSGGLSLEILRGVAAAEDIDFLMEQGIADWTSNRTVIRVKNPVMAEIVRREVPPGRSKQLQRLLDNSWCPSGHSPVRLKTYATWKLACGSALEPELALRAAEAANRSGDGESALRFLMSVTDRHTNHEAVLSEARALLHLNRPAEAGELLDSFSNGPLQLLPLAAMTDFIVERVSLACLQKDAPSEATLYLQELRARLSEVGSVPPVPPQVMGNLRDQLTLAEAVVSSYQGRYTDSIPALTSLFVNGRGASEELRLRAGGLLAEALAMIGRQDDAVRLAQEVIEKIRSSEIPELIHAELRQRFGVVYLMAGMWNECREVMGYGPRFRVSPGFCLGEIDGLGEGLLHAYAGRADLAIDTLQPTIVQLRCLRSEAALSVALAAAAYAYALRGDDTESSSCLRELRALPMKEAWIFRGPREYFSALAAAVSAPGPDFTAELLRCADKEQADGRVSHELFFLNAAVLLGELGSASRLLAVARQCQGAFAEASRVLATGLMAENPELLLTAAELAKSFGGDRFCRDAALAAHEIATRTTNRTAARRAVKAAAEIERKMTVHSPHGVATAGLDSLTGREREIVKMAVDGASNRDIAHQLHVSIRTVEGHLYQAYTKLQVSGRDALQQAHQAVASTKVGA